MKQQVEDILEILSQMQHKAEGINIIAQTQHMMLTMVIIIYAKQVAFILITF